MPQDDLQDGDQRDGDHHADDAEKLSADEDSGNDRDGCTSMMLPMSLGMKK